MNTQLTEYDLRQFTGTEHYYAYNVLNIKVHLTDGVKYLAEVGRCYWLIDAILSHQLTPKVRAEEFQVWRLEQFADDTWSLYCEDSDGARIACQNIEFSDFPLSKITVYFQNGILYLPSED